jgi:urocanate hydratase
MSGLAAGRTLRLLENVLAVGEDPDNLIVYAALGKAARN